MCKMLDKIVYCCFSTNKVGLEFQKHLLGFEITETSKSHIVIILKGA